MKKNVKTKDLTPSTLTPSTSHPLILSQKYLTEPSECSEITAASKAWSRN